MEASSFIAISVLVAALFVRGPFLLYVTFIAQSFGSMAAIPPGLLGGITLTPGWIAIALLTFQTIVMRRPGRAALVSVLDPKQLGLLTACALYGVFSAFVFPRLFEGEVRVVPMRVMIRAAVPLTPTTSNLTQALYFLLTVATVWTAHVFARTVEGRRQLLKGIMIGGMAAVLTGVLDMVASTVGLTAMLAPFRNASYALLVDAEVSFGRRVVGLMTEASSYGGLCIGYLSSIFLMRTGYVGRGRTWSWLLSLGLIVMAVLSTSSSTYVALAVCIMTIMMAATVDTLKVGVRGIAPISLAYLALVSVLLVLALKPDILDGAMVAIDQTVLQKHKTSSYAERGYWNQTALDAFLGTYGLGAGLGSLRASSWALAVLGNIGAVGAFLTAAFIAVRFSAKAPSGLGLDRLHRAAKFALIPILVAASLAGTSVYFGFAAAVLFGLISGIANAERTPVEAGRSVVLQARAGVSPQSQTGAKTFT
ncbi:hypothetical protein [Caulobacter sp. FWC2]|uniref:hypothetical protein n=1 Tax=Caulobacter sp. FWC2 TaxID=69664 RepID=UPI000C15E17C|nr:hypothetical protein [Caulobacter sp. FWC2]PIB91621.1 hypothetical protein CSW62_08585 [Caulobacter sp. FWC2]